MCKEKVFVQHLGTDELRGLDLQIAINKVLEEYQTKGFKILGVGTQISASYMYLILLVEGRP